MQVMTFAFSNLMAENQINEMGTHTLPEVCHQFQNCICHFMNIWQSCVKILSIA